MNKNIKNELGNKYKSFIVTGYTSERVKSNGCVIWEIECCDCGYTRYVNGNNLRFNKFSDCPNCKSR